MNIYTRDFHGWTVDKSLRTNAGETGLIQGRIPRAEKQLNPCTTTTGACAPEPMSVESRKSLFL